MPLRRFELCVRVRCRRCFPDLKVTPDTRAPLATASAISSLPGCGGGGRHHPRFRHAPIPPCALLVVEVSETTLRLDRHTKASLYAWAGIPEYWIVSPQEWVAGSVSRASADDGASSASYGYRQQADLTARATRLALSRKPVRKV